MNLSPKDGERRVVPRWRNSALTLATGELNLSGPSLPLSADSEAEFRERVGAWQSERTIEAAAELVSAALVFADLAPAKEAAEFLLHSSSTATDHVKHLARRVLRASGVRADSDRANDSVSHDIHLVRSAIHTLRIRTHADPRNAIAWTDMAREYIGLGQRAQSLRCMENALRLSGGNRFVLRSAARLLVHLDDHDRAHELLTRCGSTPYDPWLLAAEIAVGCVAGRTSRWMKRGREYLENRNLAPFHISELASAIGSVELRNGRVGAARKLFRRSLVQPTDNAVAQATFVVEHIPQLEVEAQALRTPRSFEARALASAARGEWAESVAESERWLEDEPFWTRPASYGSYVAEVVLQDFSLAENFARRGLEANRGDIGLTNNLVVALANQGRLDEAEREFAPIRDVQVTNDRLAIVLTATEGLLHFRRGRWGEGRSRYEDAIKRAERGTVPGWQHVAALAQLHLTREEVMARTPNVIPALKAAASILEKRTELDLAAFWKSVEKLLPELHQGL